MTCLVIIDPNYLAIVDDGGDRREDKCHRDDIDDDDDDLRDLTESKERGKDKMLNGRTD